MRSKRSSVTDRSHSAGFTLIEILVALVVSALAAIAIYSAFINTSRVFTQTKSQNNTWQQARAALAMITEAVESAGYGLPMNMCGTIYSNYPPAPNGIGGLVPVSAVAQPTTNSTYDPTGTASVNTYELTTVTGGGAFGSSPATHILTANPTSASMKVNNSASLMSGDLFLILLPYSQCILGQLTNANPNTQTVVANSGANGSLYNNHGHLGGTDPNLTQAELRQAGFVNLGNSGFAVDHFYIDYALNANNTPNPYSVPSLYLQKYTAATSSTTTVPTGTLVARGVVDMQVEFGYGTRGSVITYGAPGTQPGANVLAVKIALLVRSTRTTVGTTSAQAQGGQAAGTIALMQGVAYKIPTGLAPGTDGCLLGDCRHYIYHVFKTVIPVRNMIWNQ